jgi:ATP-dependent helicase/nuclease subunit A
MSAHLDPGAAGEERVAQDRAARREALDPSRSFIVQAPAGSGKTELLIQRVLVLLARVDEPEEISAITFTRKAAAEMRQRVLQALSRARNEPRPQAAHEALTWDLARAALARDAGRGWDLQSHAARLRVQTIDSLCASLTRQMPLLSTFGAQPESVEDARALYREAAQATIAMLDDRDAAGAWSPLSADVALLLEHLDGDAARAAEHIAGMLARRDAWLRLLRQADQRTKLEAALASERLVLLRAAARTAPASLLDMLLSIARRAAANVAEAGIDSPIRACADLIAMPEPNDSGAAAWLGLAELMLVQGGEWRKKLTKDEGFPAVKDAPERKAHKDEMTAVLDAVAGNDAWKQALHALRTMPQAAYEEPQWQVLGAIVRLARHAAAELRLAFAASGQADFAEIAQSASRALGDPDEPTDLALALDYRIRHLLVDEFQDTSISQFELLVRLTAGWQPDDGRTLFVVGDPMQSIYRFREAEVGLFLRARREGIGSVTLVPLTLAVNFRSLPGIVDWVNRSFAQLMPRAEDAASGAVPYSASFANAALDPQRAGGEVTVDACVVADKDEAGDVEAARVLARVRAALDADPEGSIAILVRARTHVNEVARALRGAGLAYRAVDIEALAHRPVVQDLFSLARAIAHPADRLAWLAVLRAPWCGLTLADLHALAGGAPRELVCVLLDDPALRERLSADGRVRAVRLAGVMDAARAQAGRASLRERVEGAWLALGGPACVTDATDLEDAEIFLDLLDAADARGIAGDPQALQEAVDKLFALPDLSAPTRLQVMTIHKAKGLEFDTVVLPRLGRGTGKDEQQLMMWMERPARDAHGPGRTELLLAPIKPAGSKTDATYAYIRSLGAARGVHEDVRLLYVAATRARRRLHLVGHVLHKPGKDVANPPPKGSLLARLWPVVADHYAQSATELTQAAAQPGPAATPVADTGARGVDQQLRRLPPDWVPPPPPAALAWRAPVVRGEAETIEFSWAGETARHVGSVAHRWLQRIAEEGVDAWSGARIAGLDAAFRGALAVRGVAEAELGGAAARVREALTRAIADERGRWLLAPRASARNEYRLRVAAPGGVRLLVMDRSFVDEQGVRWIVDYKTSSHEGPDREAFLDREQERYRSQLERYAQGARLLSNERTNEGSNERTGVQAGAVRLGLYFPLLSGWREWEA